MELSSTTTPRNQLPPAARLIEMSGSLGALYVSPRQLVELTGIGYTTWEAWRRQGRGPRWISVSKRKVLYELASVQTWLASRTVKSTAEADLLPAFGV